MTTPVQNVTQSPTTSTSTASSPTDQLGTDTFLKLLVAQLKYQNPDSPADSTQFLAQTAQFSTVEKLSSLDTTMTSLLQGQQSLAAASMLGKTITSPDTQGTVTGVHITAAGPVLAVLASGKTTDVNLSDVTDISPTTPTQGA